MSSPSLNGSRRRRLLLVDDDPDRAQRVAAALHATDLGMEVEVAHGLEEGLAALREPGFDLCVLDATVLETEDGTLSGWRGEPGTDLPVIALLDTKDRETAMKALRAGADDVLIRERLTPSVLEWSVQTVLQQARAREERKRALEEKWSKVVEVLPVGIVISEAETGRLVEVNDAFVRMFGQTRDEMLGRTSLELGHWEEPDRRRELIARLRDEGGFTGEQAWYRDAEGNRGRMLLACRSLELSGEDLLLWSVQDVTGRVERDRFLGTIAENLPGVLYRCCNDRDWTTEYLSDRIRELTGYPPEAFHAGGERCYADLIHPDDRETVWTEVQAAVAEDRPFRVDYRIRTRDGVEKWIWEQGRAVEPVAGGALRIEGYLVDISERRAAERALEDSHRRLDRLVETMNEAVTILDLDGRITFANRAAERLFGLERSEVTGRTYDDPAWRITDVEGRPLSAEDLPFERVRRSGERVTEAEHTIERGDGNRLQLSVNAAPLRDADGRTTGVVATIRDVTGQREAEARYRSVTEDILDAAPAALFILDDAFRVAWINEATETFFGLRREEVLGRDKRELVREEIEHLFEDPGEFRTRVFATYEDNDECATFRGHLLPGEGREERWLQHMSQPIREGHFAGGRVEYYLDITDLRRSLDRVERQARQQSVVAGLGQEALRSTDLDALFHRAVRDVAATLDVEYAKVLELLPSGEELLLRAGVGWHSAEVGRSTVGTGRESQAGFTLDSAHPVVVEELASETRFRAPPLLVAHDVEAGMSVVIGDPEAPWGVLGAHVREPRSFSDDEVSFLQAVANVVAAAGRREEARVRTEKSERRYRALFENSRDPIVISTDDGQIVEANDAALEFSGYEREDLTRLHTADFYVDAEDRRQLLERIRADGGVEGFEIRVRTRSGEERVVQLTTSVHSENGDRRLQTVLRDVTARRGMEEDLRFRALHDALTGLANRTLFRDRLEQAISRSRRRSEVVALLLLDVRRFKAVNDGLGHTAGDRVLEEVARRLEAHVRDEDTAARFGGDEFAVLLGDLENGEDADRAVTRLMSLLRRPYGVADRTLEMDFNVGGVLFGSGGEDRTVDIGDPDDLVRLADRALIRAKNKPGTAVHFVEHGESSEDDVLAREQDLRRALREEEFDVFFQPVIDLRNDRLWGVEALARWRHPEKGLISPAEFIPLAEETDLIHELGEQLCRQAVARAAGWRRRYGQEAPRLLLNISGRQFESESFPDTLDGILEDSGLSPDRVFLEVTESAVTRATGRVSSLRKRGLGVLIDDFGTGYSSFHYLRDLEVDGLKVDMSFVQGVTRDDADSAIVRTILTLGHRLGVVTITEGIETAEQLDRLKEMGAELGQGYHFDRPMEADAMDRRLRELLTDRSFQLSP